VATPTSESRKHSHHAAVYKCTAPEGEDPEATFEHLIGHPGGECYDDGGVIPIQFCQKMVYVWAIGGSVSGNS